MSDGTETGADVGGAGAGRAVRRDRAVRAAVEQGLLGPGTPIVGLLDVTGIR
ncbi:diaminopimelate decarboxylase, partial [Streptomyces coelicoflavus ZG0656]